MLILAPGEANCVLCKLNTNCPIELIRGKRVEQERHDCNLFQLVSLARQRRHAGAEDLKHQPLELF